MPVNGIRPGSVYVALDVVILAVVGRDVDKNGVRVLGVSHHRFSRGGIDSGLAGFGVQYDDAERFVGEIPLQMPNDFLLDFRKRQATDLHISVKAKRDAPVGANQPLARDRPAGQGIEHFDDNKVGRLDHVSGTEFPNAGLLPFLLGNVVGLCDW